MAYKRKNPYRKSILFFILTGVFLIGVIVFGIILLNNELLTITPDEETVIEVKNAGSYYILIDTKGERYTTNVDAVGATNKITITDEEENQLYQASIFVKGDNDPTVTKIEGIDFDRQIRHKGHLSFGKISLNQDNYTFNSSVQKNPESFGEYVLLSTSYVNKIGAFSLSALTTLLFGLLGFKHFSDARKIPLSSYQKKRIKI